MAKPAVGSGSMVKLPSGASEFGMVEAAPNWDDYMTPGAPLLLVLVCFCCWSAVGAVLLLVLLRISPRSDCKLLRRIMGGLRASSGSAGWTLKRCVGRHCLGLGRNPCMHPLCHVFHRASRLLSAL